MDDFQPSMRIRSVELELGGQLVQPVRVDIGSTIPANADLCKKEDLNSCASTIPPWTRNAVFVCHSTGLQLQRMQSVKQPHRVFMEMEKLTSVAAHVQADTIPDAIRPGLTLRDALLNSSVFFGEYAVYRA